METFEIKKEKMKSAFKQIIEAALSLDWDSLPIQNLSEARIAVCQYYNPQKSGLEDIVIHYRIEENGIISFILPFEIRFQIPESIQSEPKRHRKELKKIVVDILMTYVNDMVEEIENDYNKILNAIDIYVNQNAYVLQEKRVILGKILNTVLDKTKVSAVEFYSPIRKKEIADARQIFCYIADKITDCKLNDIGNYIGRNHSTVIYAIKVVKDRMTYDKSLKTFVEDIIGLLKNRI